MPTVTSKDIKNFVLEQGADMVGIAPVGAFDSKGNRRSPGEVMPQARSVVVFGQRMLRGSIESPSSRVSTIQNRTLYEELDRISYCIGRLLEREGHRAATVAAYNPVDLSLEAKGFAGDVSLRHCAHAAGLGRFGKNNLILTPELGPRVRLGGVVTDAELEPDAPLKGDVCADCQACIKACPVDALSQPGKTRVGPCLRQVLPYGLTRLIEFLSGLEGKSEQEAVQSCRTPVFWNIYQAAQMGIYYGCFACINACPQGIHRG
jgi:epoxyqueuosine reductase QueG